MAPTKAKELSKPDVRSLTIDISAGHLGVTLENTDDGTGVRIAAVDAADLVAKAGLKVGDVLLSIEGHTVDDHGDAFAAIDAAVGSIRIEYWTEAEAKTAAAIKGPKSSGIFWVVALLLFVVAVGGLGGYGYYYYQSLQTPARSKAATPKPPNSPPSAPPKPPGTPKKSKASEIMGDMLSGTIDEYEEKLETLSRAQIVKELKKKDAKWEDKDNVPVDLLRDNLVKEAEKLRRMVKEHEEKSSPEAKQKKVMKQLKLKDEQQLRELLQDVEVPFPEEASVKELREIALKEDAMAKWDAVDDEIKLEKNKVRAAENVRKFEVKEKMRKAKEKRDKQYQSDLLAEKYGAHHDNPAMQTRPYWEEDWDEEQEREALERLSQTPMWQMFDDEQLENMMKRIRNNPKVLDMLVAETENMQKMKPFLGPNGEMPEMDVMRAMGMDFKATNFDKDNPAVIV